MQQWYEFKAIANSINFSIDLDALIGQCEVKENTQLFPCMLS
jgi:hypothetical protein